jgi:hypothetical protein
MELAMMTALILKWRGIFAVRRAHFMMRKTYNNTGEFG